MTHPLFDALWIIFNIAVIVVLIWGAYTLAQMRKALEQLRKP
jgi:ABC-type multidrug transport system permease subunit